MEFDPTVPPKVVRTHDEWHAAISFRISMILANRLHTQLSDRFVDFLAKWAQRASSMSSDSVDGVYWVTHTVRELIAYGHHDIADNMMNGILAEPS